MSVELAHQRPGARVAHLHAPAGRGDRAGLADALEEVRLTGPEGHALAQDDAQAQMRRRFGHNAEFLMQAILESLRGAVALIFSADPVLGGIVLLSLKISLSAVLFATLLGLPLGAAIAVGRFPG